MITAAALLEIYFNQPCRDYNDLTYSNTYYGKHTTTIAGNDSNPGIKELIEVGTNGGLKKINVLKSQMK